MAAVFPAALDEASDSVRQTAQAKDPPADFSMPPRHVTGTP